MNTIFKSLFVLLAFLPVIYTSNAQVADYSFTETTGSYQAIVNNTAVVAWSGTIIDVSSNRTTTTLPFSFCMGGTTFSAGTSFTMSHDGWAAFGDPAVNSTTSTQPLNNFNNCLSAFGTDLHTTGTSSYGARVIGTSPNRVLVLQWGQRYFGDSNQSPFVTTNYWRRAVNGHSNDRLHFQIKLYETTGVIEFCYLISNPRTSSSGTLTTDVQVGLRGANATDFNVRTRTGTNVVWNGNNAAAPGLPSGSTNTMHFNNVQNVTLNKPTFVIPSNPGNTTTTANAGTATIFRWTPVVTDASAPVGSISNCAVVPLPVELSEFGVEVEEKTNKLYWTTISERNSDYFTIERSLNGAEWDYVGSVKGAGNSNNEIKYELEDRDFMKVINYYRLKQVDYDGTTKIYNMVSADNRTAKKDLIKTVNLMGQEVGPLYTGIVIEIYSDGSTEKYLKR
jgi:hypothetical protein